MNQEAGSFDSSLLRASLAGRWEGPQKVEWEPDGRERVHFTAEGETFQFIVSDFSKPEKRKRFKFLWFPVSSTGFCIRLKPDGPITRHGCLNGDSLSFRPEDGSWERTQTRVPPERVPAWFQDAQAAALE